MGKNMYAKECEVAGCEELCYYGSTVCNSCQDWPEHIMMIPKNEGVEEE
mgnify:FL=1|tara:strand:+ start:38 stop:184 length:147 start_codon:yes stop_codon:yes gene_type:complete